MSRIMERITGLLHRPQSTLFKAAGTMRTGRRRSKSTLRQSATTLGTIPALSGTVTEVAMLPNAPLSVEEDQATGEASSDTPAVVEAAAQDAEIHEQEKAHSEVEAHSDPDISIRSTTVRDLIPSLKRERSELKARSYDQVISLIERIGDHLDTQTERSDRMVTLLERLPDAIDALPEIRRNGQQLNSAIESHFANQHERDGQLRETIAELSTGANQQAEALNLIHREIQAGHQREAEMNGVLSDFRKTLSNFDHTNQQSVGVLKTLVVRSRESESKFAGMLFRQNRTLLIVAGAAVISSLAGLTVAVIALIKAAGV